MSISSNSNRNSYLLTVNKIGKSFKIPPFLLLSVCVWGGGVKYVFKWLSKRKYLIKRIAKNVFINRGGAREMMKQRKFFSQFFFVGSE